MDPVSPDDFFAFPPQEQSPGAQLYLYRLLHLLTAHGPSGFDPILLSYQTARQLAIGLGLTSRARLVSLFGQLGIGQLELQLDPQAVSAILVRSEAPAPATSMCQLEKGLIDGALSRMLGAPVMTAETQCWSSGASECRFEAVLIDFPGGRCFMPPSYGNINSLGGPASGFGGPTPGFGGPTSGFGGPTSGFGDSGFDFAPGVRIPAQNMWDPLATVTEMPGFAGVHARKTAPEAGAPRSWFLDLAGRELARARRYGRPLTVLYIDLDDLGQINQAHGRAAGDQVISAVAAALSKSCRSEDHLWHHGEDEFAVVLCETDESGAETVARRLMTRILSAAEFVEVSARVSASIGFSSYPSHAEDVSALFSSARSALYLAKSLGKGRFQSPARSAAATKSSRIDGNDFPANRGKTSEPGRRRREANFESSSQEKLRPDAWQPRNAPADVVDGTATEGDVDTVEDEKQMGTVPAANHAAKSDGKHEGSTEAPTANGGRVSTLETDSFGVLIASGSPVLRAGLKEVISSGEGIKVITESKDASVALRTVRDLRPDLIFADLDIAIANDFALSNLLIDENLPCKLAIFAMEVDQDVLKLAADYSVDGIILQRSSQTDIIEALRTIFRGKTVLPEEARSAIHELEDNRRLLADLSEREVEVLRLVAEGKSNSQISEQLFITVNTVRFHLANVYQKLGVSNRTGAANYYLRQDLTSNAQTKLL